MDDPILADNGYPSDAELERIKEWPVEHMRDLRYLMEYVKTRWNWPDWGWSEEDVEEHGQAVREYRISTGGWSGNESLIAALESNTMFSIIAPWSWRRGGHYVYRISYDKEATDATP